jgi:hypothetical protein
MEFVRFSRAVSVDKGYYRVEEKVLTEKPNKMQQCINILLFLNLNEAQHVSGNTPPIIRSLKLHKQPLVLHNTLTGCRTCSCWTLSGSIRYLTTYAT